MNQVIKLRIRWLLPLALVIGVVGLLAAACGGGDEQTQSAGATPGATPAADEQQQVQQSTQQSSTTGSSSSSASSAGQAEALAGEIAIDGSSTVFPITEAMAAEFGILHTDVRVTVGVSGTGGGFQRFCVGETDITDASRPIKDAEAEICAENGVEFIEVPVAYDGLTVVIHPDNDWIDSLTVAELNHIFRPDNYATSWADVRDGFPDVEISLFAPGADSGTFDYFTETINDGGGVHRSDNTTFSEDDNVLVQGVSGERGGIGYFGYSYFANNQDRLKAVPILNDAGEAVLPNLDSINSGAYNPLSQAALHLRRRRLARPPRGRRLRRVLHHRRRLPRRLTRGWLRPAAPGALHRRPGARAAADRRLRHGRRRRRPVPRIHLRSQLGILQTTRIPSPPTVPGEMPQPRGRKVDCSHLSPRGGDAAACPCAGRGQRGRPRP